MMRITADRSLLVDWEMLCAMVAGCWAMARKVHAGGGAGDQHHHAEDSSEIAQGLLHAEHRFLQQYKRSGDV
jgi:hypothetical protein